MVTLGKILFWSFNQNPGNEFIHEFFIGIPFLLFPFFKQFRVEFPNPSVILNSHPWNDSLFEHLDLSAHQELLHPRSCNPDWLSQPWHLLPHTPVMRIVTKYFSALDTYTCSSVSNRTNEAFPLRIFSCLIKLHSPYSFSMNGNINVVSLAFYSCRSCKANILESSSFPSNGLRLVQISLKFSKKWEEQRRTLCDCRHLVSTGNNASKKKKKRLFFIIILNCREKKMIQLGSF